MPALPHALCYALRTARLLPCVLPACCPAHDPHAALLAPCSASASPCPAACTPPCPVARAPPSLQPARRPALQPTCRPALQPPRRPALQPTRHPALQPARRPALQPARCPALPLPCSLRAALPYRPRATLPCSPRTAQPCSPCVARLAAPCTPYSPRATLERYFLLVVDDYTHYTTVFLMRSKANVPGVLIPWIIAVRCQLRARFQLDLQVPQLHSDRRSEFSSSLLEGFCRAEGIAQSFTLSASPQQNGIAERGIGLIMEVARTSMIHAAAPHFLWPFAVRYAAHQLNLWPRVSVLETSPTLRWTGEVGDASAFRSLASPGPCPHSRARLRRRAFPASRGGNAPLLTPPRFRRPLLLCRLSQWTGGEFSSGLLEGFCRAEGIAQSFTLPASSHQNGIAEHGIGLIIEVARTSMIHADAPHFLWPFAVRYATHQLNLWPRVSVPETLPTLRWTGEVGDASAFRVWGVLSLVHDTTAGKLSLRTLCCIFLGFPTDSPPGSLTTLPRAGSCPQRTSLLTSRSASTVSTRMRLLLSPDRRSTWSLVPPK
ncbi:unnamed protein product [Closterium sp. NIES-54]